MPRLKRNHIFVVFVAVFLFWNVIIYYSLAGKNENKEILEEQNVEVHLEKLHAAIQDQLRDNEEIIKTFQDLQKYPGKGKKELEKRLSRKNGTDITLPVLMFACDRITVHKSLDALLKYRPSAKQFPIIVSQDCGHQPTADVIQSYITVKKTSNFIHIQHPDLSDIPLAQPQKKFLGYYKIARHYRWALDQVFHVYNYTAVIIVEDDLEFSPDFFEYFLATYPLLDTDKHLWCVSAWNDNGKASLVSNETEKLYRTDFFPGLGWMIKRELWLELGPKWPATFWDDWMRHQDQRKDRQCIRPEICRTSTFGKIGVSKGMFFDKHLKFIKLNTEFVPWTQKDLSYLLKEQYDEKFVQEVYSAPEISPEEAMNLVQQELTTVRIQYNTKEDFKRIAKFLGIMDDLKAGVPRQAYRGIVSFMLGGRRVYLAPPPDWTGYDVTWN